MIWAKLVFGGFGRRGVEAVIAGLVLIIAAAIVAGSGMVVEGAASALARAERTDRPDVVQVKARFNRALFETPRSGNLPPATLPVYEPLIDPEKVAAVAGGATVLARQSFLRNVVSPEAFLNVYIFGIDPNLERRVSNFSLARGRFLRGGDDAVAVVDQASARALGVDVGNVFPVRRADGQDLNLRVVGILDALRLRDPPPRTVEAPSLGPDTNFVSGGVFVTLRTSRTIFGRETLTDALLIAKTGADVPFLVTRLREEFRLEPGVFIVEQYSRFRRKVHDFALTLVLFTVISAATALLADPFVATLLHDVYAERRRQYATLIALGFSPARGIAAGVAFGLAVALSGVIVGAIIAIFLGPKHFAMPSLMADLGAIEPIFDIRVAAGAAGVSAAAVILGIGPTIWRLLRRPMAITLAETGR
jgi:ABC-type antimicrobial peptide transport system permease subunit